MNRARIAHRIGLPMATAVVLCLAGIAPAPAAQVSGSDKAGYQRLLFELDSAETPTAALADGVLILRFSKPPGLTAAELEKAGAGYVSAVRMDSDGQTFRMALSQRLGLHTSTSGRQFALDLVPQGYAGTPPDLPPPPPPRPKTVDMAKLPALKVRGGSYAKFSRLVFDWPKRVDYTVVPSNGRISIRFQAEAKPDFSQLAVAALPWVKQAGWHVDPGVTVIDFDTDAASGYHDFRDGTHIVVDILAPKTDSEAYNPPGVGKDGDKTDAGQAAAGERKTLEGSIRETAAKLNDQAAAPAPAAAVPEPTARPDRADDTAAPAADVKVDSGTATLTLDDSPNVAAFVRGLSAFIVRDKGAPLDPKAIKKSLGEFANDVSYRQMTSGASILRIGLKAPEQLSVQQNGTKLVLTLAPQLKDGQPAAIMIGRDDQSVSGAGLKAILPGAAHVLSIEDPDAGDTMLVVPGMPGNGIINARRFVDFIIPPSAAGLVVLPLADNLTVEAGDDAVHIARPGGLALTAASLPAATTPIGLIAPGNGPSYIDFAHWAKPMPGTLYEIESRLQRDAARQPAMDANPARLTEARFLIANGLAAEALGAVKLMQASDPALLDDPQLQTIKGAADVMMWRNKDAIAVLTAPQFLNDPHAALWRGLAYAELGQWPSARDSLQKAMVVLDRYPADLQARARIAYANAAIATGGYSRAEAMLDTLPPKLPEHLFLAAELARARLFTATGRYYSAAPLFKTLKDSKDPAISAQAIYDDTIAGLAAGSLTPTQAIDRLEGLRFRWRGDGLELKTLRKLGNLYFAEQKWRQGLGILRTAVRAFPKDEGTHKVQDDMQAAFVDLFLHGKADAMAPIQALALFYDFIDLTPIGADGDEMIRHMADRLVSVDLLGPAEELLKYQVDKRLEGVAQAQVAARLAMIDLMDHKAKEALAVIRATRVAGMPDIIAHDRLLLEARALAALKQYDEAIDLIAVDKAPDTERLRADIYWESGNWPKAGQSSEAMLGNAWMAPSPLSDEQRRYVMRAAIAYSLAGDDPSVARIRSEYGAKMAPTADAAAFNIVTQSIDTQGVAFRDIAAKVAAVDTLESFMADFKKQFDKQPLVRNATN